MEQGPSISARPGMGLKYGNPAGVSSMMVNGQPHNFIENQNQQQIINIPLNDIYKNEPVSVTCHFCRIPITTRVHKMCNCTSIILSIVTFFFIWICIQCCRNKKISCMDTIHTCPSCGQTLGEYKSC